MNQHSQSIHPSEPERFLVTPVYEYLLAPESELASRLLIKRLADTYRDDRAERDRFSRNLEHIQAQQVPGVAPLTSIRRADGEPLHLMNIGDAVSLDDLITATTACHRPLPIELAAAILEQVTECLVALKKTNADNPDYPVYCELHPKTVWIDHNGAVQITHIETGVPPSLTTAMLDAEYIDYLNYTAPEQCVEGYDPDGLAVYYGFGMLAFELLSGQRLFTNVSARNLDLLSRRKMRCLHPRLADIVPGLAPLDPVLLSYLNPIPRQRMDEPEYLHRQVVELFGSPLDRSKIQPMYRDFLEASEEHPTEELAPGLPAAAHLTDITELNAS